MEVSLFLVSLLFLGFLCSNLTVPVSVSCSRVLPAHIGFKLESSSRSHLALPFSRCLAVLGVGDVVTYESSSGSERSGRKEEMVGKTSRPPQIQSRQRPTGTKADDKSASHQAPPSHLQCVRKSRVCADLRLRASRMDGASHAFLPLGVSKRIALPGRDESWYQQHIVSLGCECGSRMASRRMLQ